MAEISGIVSSRCNGCVGEDVGNLGARTKLMVKGFHIGAKILKLFLCILCGKRLC